MTAQLPDADVRFDDILAWRDRVVEEAWEMSGDDSGDAPDLTNSFDITDLQHWLDLCA
jgi:hypothetical protein